MKKRLIIIIFLVVISGGTVILLLGDPWSSIDAGFEGILLDSPEKVDRIEVAGFPDTLLMLKRGDDWLLNGEEKLNSLPVESLLYTSSKFRVVSLLANEEAAAQREYVTLSFYVGRKELSSFRFMMIRGKSIIYREGGENAYMVELPGYNDLTLKKVYSADPDHFRDHLLISMLPDEIAEITITPLHGDAFSVRQDSSSFLEVSDMEGHEIVVSERKVRLLLSYFSAIRFEEYLDAGQTPTDLNTSLPSARISIRDFGGKSHELNIFQWIREGEDEADLFNALVLYDQDPQFMIVNYTYLDLLIRSLETYLPAQ